MISILKHKEMVDRLRRIGGYLTDLRQLAREEINLSKDEARIAIEELILEAMRVKDILEEDRYSGKLDALVSFEQIRIPK